VVYRLDRTTYDALIASEVPREISGEWLARLPHDVIYVETPGLLMHVSLTDRVPMAGVWVTTWHDDLAIVMQALDGRTSQCILPLDRSVGAMINHWLSQLASEHEVSLLARQRANNEMHDTIAPIITMTMYIVSVLSQEPQDRVVSGEGIQIHEIGHEIGAAIRADQSDSRAYAPHIRRAHWHTYLTGPRSSPTPVLRWMPPMAIGAEYTASTTPRIVHV
jgi:hypothetical protein